MVRVLALIFSLLPAVAQAGAWLREPGHGFFSATTYLLEPGSGGQHYAGVYLEYGLNKRLTFGLDLGRGVSGNTKSIAFLRWPLAGTGRHRVALDLGIGEIAGNPTLRPGLSYGTGFDGPLGSGWLSLETAAERNLRAGCTDYKADLTLGLNRPRHKILLQLQSGKAAGDPAFLRIAPSVTRDIGKGWQVELGLTREVIGGHAGGLKLGLWREF